MMTTVSLVQSFNAQIRIVPGPFSCLVLAEPLHINFDDLEFEGELGTGATAVVYKGRWKSRGLKVAIKHVYAKFKYNEVSPVMLSTCILIYIPIKCLFIHLQVKILSSLDHHNVVQFYGAVMKGTNNYIVTGWCDSIKLLCKVNNTTI